MSWRDELITSTSEGDDFLRRRLATLNIAPLHIEVHTRQGFTFAAETEINGEKGDVLSFEIEVDHGGGDCVWHNLDVGPSFQNKKLSPLSIKCALGVAHEFSKSEIWLSMVRHDGLSFWPTVTGAVPYRVPSSLDWYIGQTTQDHDGNIDPTSMEKLRNIKKIAADNPYGGWRALSQTDIKLPNGRFFKEIVFGEMCTEDQMLIPLGDPGARSIIRKHVGIAPNFRPSQKGCQFQGIIDQLESYRKIHAPILAL